MAVSVQIQRVCKSYGDTRALDDLSLTVNPGELFFLLGPSGCGKTTLLRAIAGFCPLDSGAICLGDRDITALPAHARDTGMVFQSYALWPHMTVRQNVEFGLEVRHVDAAERRARADEALAMVRMSDRAEAKPNELSGGQQQRVALARALVIRPQCLLLDEPLSNLDARLRLDMRTEIRAICKDTGLTAVYVTHDQKEALAIADRLAIMDGGRLQQVGTPREVYVRPRSRFVAGFIGETNFLEGVVVAVAGEEWSVQCSFGKIVSRVPPPEKVREGDRVTLSLRPEVLHLGEPPHGFTGNVFDGLVRHTVYLGEMAQHQVHLLAAGDAAGPELKVFDLNPKILARNGEAHRTRLWFRPENVVVLTT